MTFRLINVSIFQTSVDSSTSAAANQLSRHILVVGVAIFLSRNITLDWYDNSIHRQNFFPNFQFEKTILNFLGDFYSHCARRV